MRDPRLQEILDRSASDPAFRQRLLTEPHRAVRETFGIEIPETFRLRFIEKSPDDDALIVLPAAWPATPARVDGELDDVSLEAVAGGWSEGDGTGVDWNGGTGGDWNGGPGADWDPATGDWSNWK